MARYVITQHTPVKDYSPVFGYEVSRNPGSRTATSRTLGKSDNHADAIEMAIDWLTEIDHTDTLTVALKPSLPFRRERVVFHAYGQRRQTRWSL